MNGPWPLVALGKVISLVERAEEPIAGRTYRQIGVRLWGEGAYERDPIDGGQTRYKRLSRVDVDDIIVNKIWARNGSVAVVPLELAGCYGSAEFPTFVCSLTDLDPRWFHWLTKTRGFWDQCEEQSRGTSGKNRIRPERFLKIEIPLPSLAEQRRLVALINQLADKVEAARDLRRAASEEAASLMTAEEMRIWPGASLQGSPRLGDLATYLARGRQSKQGDSEHYLIKTRHVQMGKYVRSELTLAPDVAAKVRPEARARKGDVLIACSAAGCLGRIAYYGDSDEVVSTDTHVAIARANESMIMPQYLYAYLAGAQGQLQLRSRERGDWTREKVGFRLTELNLTDLKRVPVPVPPMSEQRRIVDHHCEWQAKVDTLKSLQADTAADLDAMLPSVLGKAFKGEL